MGKKLTIEFVKSAFEKEGWVCVSKEYINAHSKLNYICQKGHNGSVSWNTWRQGIRCPICSSRKKLTIEFVKSEFEKGGCVCSSKEYVNADEKLNYTCPEGHDGVITWHAWQRGSRCPTCFGNKKLTTEFVKSEFEKEGWVLISKEYINSRQKLYCICSKGHHRYITWSNWQQKRRCPLCAMERMSLYNCGSGNPSWKGGISKEPYCQDWTKGLKEFVKERDGYRCLNQYCNSKNPNKLVVHHIDYNKKFCEVENLITICRSCNTAANKDREWHESWYKAILYRRCGY